MEWENTVSQWAIRLNSAPAAVDNWHLKGHKLNLKGISFLSPALYNRETHLMVSSSTECVIRNRPLMR